MKSLGICIGATTLTAVTAGRNPQGEINRSLLHLKPHDGNPRRAFLELLTSLPLNQFQRIAVTGRKFRSFVNLTSLPEPLAVETALSFLSAGREPLNAVISAGGESFLIYVIGKDGKICSIQTGNKCASGTGEFADPPPEPRPRRSHRLRPTGAALQGIGTLQRFLQKRLYARHQQGHPQGKNRFGPLRDDGGKDPGDSS
ncbi:MAG: hypothetical protein RBR16_07525 [Syntrophus sp. (in: bacteria)]|jgi:hypothetical protein|nr:hypothetical protein [Syntrophus sp. (in: bacteria)]